MSVLFWLLIQTLNSFDSYVGWSIAEFKKKYRLQNYRIEILMVKFEKKFQDQILKWRLMERKWTKITIIIVFEDDYSRDLLQQKCFVKYSENKFRNLMVNV